MEQPSGPCAGLKVIEFATMVSGPFGGQMLADLGADVIKVEPLGGDPLRMIRPHHKGMSGMFMQFNRNKRSIALDLKSAEGGQIARKLALGADVVLENNRAGVMKRLGLDYESLAADNGRLIFLSLSGFGEDGPYAERLAYEHLLQGLSGLMRNQGRQSDRSQGIQNMIVDKSSGLMASNAILAALLQRERTGAGQRISLSLLNAVAAFGLPEQIGGHTFLSSGEEPTSNPNTFFPVETSDGAVIGYLQQRIHFVALCRTFGREDLLDDKRFESDIDIFRNLNEVWAEMQKSARHSSTSQLVEAAATHGAPLAPINGMEDFFDDPQVRYAGIFDYVEDAELGKVRAITYPARFSRSDASIRRLAPRLGAHTREILTELGYGADTIGSFQNRGVASAT